ncbi:MAG TPA: DUF6174 domain-containing protein [Gemmatimonadaceae bacterium]|nr:DUF6174 domain-containing protein [Gemmatimonadaceae bacterium]
MRSILAGLALAGALLGCSSVSDVGVAAQLSLDLHEAKWKQRTFSSYTCDLVQQKFGITSNVRITVHDTTVVSVIDNTTGLPPEANVGWTTIDGLYADAQSVVGSKYTTLQVEFDEQYSYPTLVSMSNNDPGGPFTARVSNLSPLP